MHLNESVTFIVTHFLITVLYFIVTNFLANDEKEARVIKKALQNRLKRFWLI
jgi:hypothetical protein